MADGLDKLLFGLGRGLRNLLGGSRSESDRADEDSVIRTNQGQSARAHEHPETSDRSLMDKWGVELGRDGRFHCQGYSFTTLDQAVGFGAHRQRSAEAALPASPPQPVPRPITPSRPLAREPQWLSEPTELVFADLQFTTDLVYFGTTDRYAHPPNNALVDPDLKISSIGDPSGATLPYWPSYAQLDPRARRTFLEWLAGGRSNPRTEIGYVFIFFYGLERRLIHDQAYGEADRILAEVQRLLDLYGSNYSFERYAGALLDAGDLLRMEQTPIEPSLSVAGNYEVPLGLRVQIGKRLRADEPIGADDALSWILALPDTYLRTPASRCFEELRALWAIRFAERFPEGLKVKPPKARIKHVYRAASGNYSMDFTINDLPDISAVSAPVSRLRDLLSACTEELDALSRLLGRQPQARGSIAAAAIAPAPLRERAGGAALKECIESIGRHVEDGGTGLAPVGDILRLLQIEAASEAKISVPVQRQLATLLELLDYGFEPDRRYGATAPLTADGRLALFRSPSGGKVQPDRAEFVAARTMVDISALAALADGVVVPLELESIARDLAALPGLDEVERVRLLARARVMLEDPPKRRDALKRLSELPDSQRRAVTRSAVSAVLSDGRVSPAEVKFLESLHEALGLPKDDVYVALHRHSVADDEPVTISGEARTAGVPLPPDEKRSGAVTAIDEQRLARIRQETLAVSELLAGIFVEEEEKAAPATHAASEHHARFLGLDEAHGELLWATLTGPLSRAEFEQRAKEVGVLADGAIETINEWGFETLDEPVLDDGETIEAAEHLLPRLAEMGARS
jgi:tellurite resistance protein